MLLQDCHEAMDCQSLSQCPCHKTIERGLPLEPLKADMHNVNAAFDLHDSRHKFPMDSRKGQTDWHSPLTPQVT